MRLTAHSCGCRALADSLLRALRLVSPLRVRLFFFENELTRRSCSRFQRPTSSFDDLFDNQLSAPCATAITVPCVDVDLSQAPPLSFLFLSPPPPSDDSTRRPGADGGPSVDAADASPALPPKRGRGRPRGNERVTQNLSLAMLKEQFAFPLKLAAARLGVSETTLKNACRMNGVARWPFRSFSSSSRRSSASALQPRTNLPPVHVPRRRRCPKATRRAPMPPPAPASPVWPKIEPSDADAVEVLAWLSAQTPERRVAPAAAMPSSALREAGAGSAFKAWAGTPALLPLRYTPPRDSAVGWGGFGATGGTGREAAGLEEPPLERFASPFLARAAGGAAAFLFQGGEDAELE